MAIVMGTMAQQTAPSNMTNYRGKNGQTFIFKVTGTNNGRIWGGKNNIYTDDSDVATAAVHAGVVKVGETKTISIKVLADQGNYPALTRNGIGSNSYGAWKGAYQFIGQGTAAIPDAPENMTAYRGKNGQIFTFQVKGKTDGRIWGGQNNIYTDDTNLATAAVHAGVVKNGMTATIKVKILAGQNSYPSLKRNGITSNSYGNWNGSYQILGGTSSTQATPSGTTSNSGDERIPQGKYTYPVPSVPTGVTIDRTVRNAPANLTAFRGQYNKVYCFRVKWKSTGKVWGATIFKDDSDLQTSATCDLLMRPGDERIIWVQILPGLTYYGAGGYGYDNRINIDMNGWNKPWTGDSFHIITKRSPFIKHNDPIWGPRFVK